MIGSTPTIVQQDLNINEAFQQTLQQHPDQLSSLAQGVIQGAQGVIQEPNTLNNV